MSETDWEKYTREHIVEIAHKIASGELPMEIVGNRLRVKRADLERLIVHGKLPPLDPA